MIEETLKRAAEQLSEEQKRFIMDELKIDELQFDSLSEDDWDEVYDHLCDLEIFEIADAAEDKLSDRGELVCSIVTMLGNAIAVAVGYYDEQEFEEELSETESDNG